MTAESRARDGQTKVRTYGRLEWGVNGTRRSLSIGFARSLIDDHAADDLAEP